MCPPSQSEAPPPEKPNLALDFALNPLSAFGVFCGPYLPSSVISKMVHFGTKNHSRRKSILAAQRLTGSRFQRPYQFAPDTLGRRDGPSVANDSEKLPTPKHDKNPGPSVPLLDCPA